MAEETPPYSFVAKNGQVAWDAVMGFDLAPFLSGQNVAPNALGALDDLSRQLEEARIEPDPGVNPETNTDRLARLAVVLQLSSEYQAMRAEDLQVAVEKKDRELDVMDEQMEQLERGGARTDTSLEAEADAARSRAEEADRRMSLQTQELEALKEQLERHVAETRESKRALDEASSRARAAEDDVKEMQERLANETRKMQAKIREDNTAAQRASQRNQEVARYQKENAMLASENERLSGKIETLMAECVGYSETIVRLDDAAQAWRGKEADVEAAAEAIRRERDQLAAQLETTQSDLEERTEMLMVFEERFAEEHAAWKRERAELEEETARLKHAASMERERAVSAAAAPGDSPTGSARGALASPRRQHAMSRARSAEVRGAATDGLHPDDPRYVEELEAEVAELRDLRVLLLEAYDQLEKDVGREIDIALQRQNRHHANLEAKVSAQDEALRQEHKRFTSMDRALSEAQDELAMASRRNAEYETGVYGLSEAMRDLKALRLQVRAADDQVRDAVETSNELGRKVEDLTEETRFLRQKAGIPEDADIDLGAFKIRSKVEAAQLRALNAQLEREVHELEEDRRRLRNELRYRAKWQGEHAAKLGLSARQLAMLEEFADALRFGQETNFVVEGGAAEGDAFSAQRAVDNVNARAVNELEEANRHLQERLAEALERARRSGVELDAPRADAPVPRGAGPDAANAANAAQAQAQFEQQQAQLAQAQAQFEQQQQAHFAQQQAQLEQQQLAQQQREVEQAAQQAQARGQDPVAAAAAMLALSQQAAASQQQQLQQQYQQQFEQQQAQWQASAPQTVIERVVEPDPQSAAQIAELQRQLQRARSEIVRLEDGYHDAMMRSSQNYSAASNAAATQAAAMAAATQAAAFAAMSQVSRPSTPPPAPTSTETSRPASPLVPSLSDAIQRNAHSLLSKTRVRLQERHAEAARAKAEAEAAARRAAEDVEAAKRRAELESRDAAAAESNAAAVAATASALAEAQRVAAAAAAAAEATASQFEQARARENQAGQVAAEKAEETRAAQLEAEAAVRRAEEEARSAARRAEEEALAASRRAEEDARHARDQARSRAEDERAARSAAQAEAAQKAFAAQSEAAARALAEAQRAAMEATRAARSAAQQLEEMRARQAVVPQPQLPPSPPAATEPAASAPVPVASLAPSPPAPPAVAPARVPTATVAPPETTTTTTTTTVETIDAPTAAAITPAHAMTSPVYAVPVEQRRETVGLTINVTPPAEATPALPRTTSGTQADLQVPPSPRRTSGTQADLQVPPSPRHTRTTSGTQADLQVPPSPRRTSGSQTADLPGASSVAPPQAAAAPAPAAAAVFHPSSPAAPAPAPVASAPMATQSDLPEEDVVAASDYAKAIAAVDRLRGERDELRARLRKMKSSAASDEREIYDLKRAVHQLGEQTQAAQHRMQQQEHEIQDMSAALQQTRLQVLSPTTQQQPMAQQPTTAASQASVAPPPAPPAPEPLPPFAPAPVAAFDVSAGLGDGARLAGASEARLREECASADRALAALASDLQAKELELEQLASEVARYDGAMREMGSTRASLYREHVRAVAGWAEERVSLAARAARAETEAEACRAEAKDARSLVERLKPGAESGLKEALAAAHARLAVLQARETRLSRALESATATEKRVAKERDATRDDLKEMSKAARERLAFHETRADEAEARFARARRELDACVPIDTHARVVAEAKALQARHKELLESRLESAVAASKLAAAEEDAAAARAEAETAVAAARVAEARAAAFEKALEKCAEDAAHPSALDAVALRRDAAELEARLEASARAEALARRDAARAESAAADAAKDAAALETALSAAKAQAHAAREAERAHIAELAARASEQKTRADAEALAAAAEDAARARADARRSAASAASAESALADAKASADAAAAELASLRAASKDMERRSDAAAALARANEEVLRGKAAEAALAHRADLAEAEADRLHAEATRLHEALVLSARQLECVRSEAHQLAAVQEEALSRVEGAVAGAVDPEKAAAWEKALAALREGSARREAALEAARGATSDALARAEVAETQLEAMRDEAGRRDARAAVRGETPTSPNDVSEDAEHAAELVRETRRLGEEALAAKLEAQRARRVERAAQERVAHLERVAAERESRVVQLEEIMARDALARDVERDDAARALRAARRDALDAAATAAAAATAPPPLEGAAGGAVAAPRRAEAAALPAPPAPRRKPDSEALAAVGTAAASGVAPAGASPETHRVVLEQIEAIRALKLRAADAEAAASAATREAAHAAATCRHAEEERDALMARLEKQVASTSARGGGVQTAGEESAVAQVTAVAQSTIARLQDLVADKNRALTRAQQAMTDLRADAVEKQAEDRATIEELNELLFKQNQREIANMREAVTFGVESTAVSGGAPSGSNKAESSAAARSKTRGGGRFADASRDDLIAMIDEKEVAVEALTMKYEQQRARHESAEARLQEAADLRVGEANRVVAQASRSAGASQSAKVLETLVSRLKTQLSSKEKRIAQLKDAVRELEKKLGDALTRSADVAARAAGTVSERAASRAGEENKTAVLAEKLRRAQDALARLEARERDWNEEKRALLQEKRAARRRESAESAKALGSSRPEAAREPRGSRAPPRGLAGGVAISHDDADAHAAAALAVARERAEELENRVKALTARNAKLDRMLRAEREAERNEAALKESVGVGARSDREAYDVNDENEAVEDSLGAKTRREETLARWEEGVKLRKRAETLAKKLSTKTRELEAAEKLVERGRNAVADAAKEKHALAAKLRAATDALAGKAAPAKPDAPDPEAARKLHLECEALHRELASTRRVVDVEQAGEMARLQRRVDELEADASAGASRRPERSALETRVRVLETDLLSKEDAEMGLRFEAEQQSARADRLQRRLDELFRRPGSAGGFEKGSVSGRDAASRRAQELEDVVDALKKVVEKQQSELSSLRARLASAARVAEAAKTAKALKQTVASLEAEVAELRGSEEEATSLRRKCVDLERRLAARSRATSDDAAAASILAQAQAEAADAALRLAETRDALAASEGALDAARADAARARALGGGDSETVAERLRLENADLRAELDALDPAFFDEVMAMKRAYAEQTETVARYEAKLRRFAAQLGESFEPEPRKE